MKTEFIRVSKDLVFLIIPTAAIVAILFFLPTTSEFFEFNKFSLILIMIVIGTLLWAARMVAEKKFTFTRTPLDIPLLILVTVSFIATLSSVDQFVSFVGTSGKIWPSFFTFATLVAFYFLATSNLRTRKQVTVVIWAIIGATTSAAVIAITSYFGLFLPYDFAHIRTFNTLGIINRLALLEAIVLPLSLSWAVFSKDIRARAICTVASIVILASLVLIAHLEAFIALAVGLTVIAVGNLKTKMGKNAQTSTALIAIVALLFLVLRFVPQVASGTLNQWIAKKDPNLSAQQQVDTPKEISPKNRASWDVASQTIGKRPLFGTGPATFKFAFGQLKPRYLNSEDTWSVRFEKASSDFAETLTTTGIVGTLAYLLVVVVAARYLFALVVKSPNTALYMPLVAAATTFLVITFISTTSFSIYVIAFIILALISTLAKAAGENHVFDVTVELATLKDKFSWFPLGTSQDFIKTNTDAKGSKSQILPGLFLVAVIIASFIATNYQVKAYRGEYFYRKALLAAQANDGNRTLDFLQQAIGANPSVDTYHRVLSQTALAAAVNLNAPGKLTEDQQKLLAQLAQVAVDQGKVASGYQILPLRIPGISAVNVTNWETLSNAYQSLIGSVTGSDVHAVNTLTQAVSLDPQNPVLHDRLGLLYQRTQNSDLAQRKFEDAIIVKGDFGPAHYHLAKLLIEKKAEPSRIVSELSFAKQFLPKEDPALKEIEDNLKIYGDQLKDQQAKQQTTQSPTDASPTPGATPHPTPSPSPSPSTSPSPSPSF
ncbi:MAG: O-antigen ligase family protein [Candidatus Berkelbacteria bacterium]|nr:O-antigen ligase family protein [Candidatus Berkelbacteria bacterium]